MGAAGLADASAMAVLNANYIAARLNPYFPVLYTGEHGRVAHECIIDLRPITKATGVTVDDVAKRLVDYGFHAPTMSFPVSGTLMIEPTESEIAARDRSILRGDDRHQGRDRSPSHAGSWEFESSPLRNAPHTAEDLIGEWKRPYDRELGAYPVAALRASKYFPPVSRIDAAYGDRNLICSCEPLESLADLELRKGYGSTMAQTNPPGISDLLGLFGGANPFGAITKSIGQFQRGVSDFLSAVENFNKTMEQMHGVAERVNSLLDTVEEPIKALVPQLNKVVKAADTMVDQLSGPIDRVAPGLVRLADVLSSPTLSSLPTDLGEFMSTLSELARKLQPLGQMADSAGSLFGGLRPFASLLGGNPPPPAPPSIPQPAIAAAKPAVAKKQPAAKKTAAKKSPAKKAAAKKAPTKRPGTKKAASKS